MTDPLSISASIAGIITLADTVFLSLKKYVRNAKGAEKEIEQLAKEVMLLGGSLHSLSRLARSFEDAPFNQEFRIHHIQSCNDILTDISKKLRKCEGNSVKKKLTWAFSADRARELLTDLSRHKESIDLALSANTMDLLLRHLSKDGVLEKTTTEILEGTKKSREITTRIHKDDERRKVLAFFLHCNPQQNYEMSLSLRYPRTGLWLIRLPKFQTWLSQPGGKLWFSGIPGAGKTVLAGSIVEAVLAACNEHVASAFFFCDYKDDRSHQPVNILSALAYQLAVQKEDVYRILEEYFNELHPQNGLPRSPTVARLEHIVVRMVQVFDRVFLAFDGIDECQKLADKVLESLCSISGCSDNVSITLLSRDEPAIRDFLEEEDFDCEEIAAHREDITEYVTSEIEERIRTKRLHIEDLNLKGEILEGLIDGAKGRELRTSFVILCISNVDITYRFRWVACQLDHLCGCLSDKACREALSKLPPDLNGTYMRILQGIRPDQSATAQMALNFIGYANPKPEILELRELLSVPDDGGLLDSSGIIREDAIRGLCSSFVRKSNDGRHLEFAHFSVREFSKITRSYSPIFRCS